MNHNCTNIVFIERNILALFFFVGALVVIWFGHKFIKTEDIHVESMQTKYKTYYFVGKIYCVSIILMFVTYTIYGTYYCTNPISSAIIRSIGATFYGIEHNLLIFLLFYRLQLAFDDSVLQLTSCNIWLFYIIYLIYFATVIILNIFMFTGDLYTPFGAMMIFITWVLQFVLIIWITIIFIFKLRVISFDPHSQSEEDVFNAQMMFITTKMALLTIFAITPNFMAAAIRVYAGSVQQSPEIDFISLLGSIIDVLSNYVAILLGFKLYEAHYMKCCGCCHRKCIRCCVRSRDEQNLNHVQLTAKQQKQQQAATDKTDTITKSQETYLPLDTQTKTSKCVVSSARVGTTTIP